MEGRSVSSASSHYITDCDEVEMEFETQRKRKIEERSTESGGETPEEAAKKEYREEMLSKRRNITHGERERNDRELLEGLIKNRVRIEKKKRREMGETEEEWKVTPKQKSESWLQLIHQEEEEIECEDRVGNIQKKLAMIDTAVSRETGGKISVTKGDQAAVKTAIGGIKDEAIEIMKQQMKVERKLAKAEQESKEWQERYRRSEEQKKELIKKMEDLTRKMEDAEKKLFYILSMDCIMC